MSIVMVHGPPKGLHFKVEVDGRGFDSDDEIMEVLKNVLRGKAFYMKTNFRDPKSPRNYGVHKSRQKHFADGYNVWTVWFSRKKDAALFKLMTSTAF